MDQGWDRFDRLLLEPLEVPRVGMRDLYCTLLLTLRGLTELLLWDFKTIGVCRDFDEGCSFVPPKLLAPFLLEISPNARRLRPLDPAGVFEFLELGTEEEPLLRFSF